ncbi:MAG: ThiF family adenylyltransferase [Synergistaceae bacterium]|nr:ThiF family adenylyltransferase [Synergistaceae bacterium]
MRDESGYLAVPLAVVREIASSEGLGVREFEAELLNNGIIPYRYLRNIGTLGTDGQAKLLTTSAAVVGCGGLGGLIVELLARAGVGRLTLIDGDVFSDSNLNRQALCTEAALGLAKAEAAAARVRAINGAVETVPYAAMLTEGNAKAFLEGNSIVFDALDNLPSRRLLLKAARGLGITVIHGAIAGWWGQVCVAEPGSEILTSLWEGKGEKGAETTVGTPGFTPSAVASLQVALGIRTLLGLETPASKYLFLLNLEGPGLERLPLER